MPDVLRCIVDHVGDILFHKHYFDVFTNPNVGPVLDTLGIDAVVLYGVALDVCNRYAVEGLLARHPDVEVTVVADAVRVPSTRPVGTRCSPTGIAGVSSSLPRRTSLTPDRADRLPIRRLRSPPRHRPRYR